MLNGQNQCLASCGSQMGIYIYSYNAQQIHSILESTSYIVYMILFQEKN